MASAKFIGAGLAAIGLTGAGIFKYAVSRSVYVNRKAEFSVMSRSFSKCSPTSEFFKGVREADKGQDTDNVFIICNRFIESGNKPNAEIINTVLKLEGNDKINDDMLRTFYKLYDGRVHFGSVPINKEEMVIFRRMESEGRAAGVYVYEHKVTGEQYVGSSKDLVTRVRDHYYGRSHGRLAQYLAKDGINNYKVSVTVLPADLATQSNILALEQFLILLLNPSINYLKVANSSHKVYSDVEVSNMRDRMGHKLYVYHKGLLVYIFGSVHHCFKELGEANNFSERVLGRMKGVYRQDLLFTKRPIRSGTEKLMTLADFKVLFAKVKRADKRVQALPNNTQAVKTTLNGVEVQHQSLAAMTKWLEQETGKRCSRITLTKYLGKGIDYQGYKLERVNLDHPGYRFSESE